MSSKCDFCGLGHDFSIPSAMPQHSFRFFQSEADVAGMFEECGGLTEQVRSHQLVLIRGNPFDGVMVKKVDASPMGQLFKAGCLGAGAAVSRFTREAGIVIGDRKEVFRFLREAGKVERVSGALSE